MPSLSYSNSSQFGSKQPRSSLWAKLTLFSPVAALWTHIVFFTTTNDAFFDNAIGCNATNLLFVSFRLLVVEGNRIGHVVTPSTMFWQRLKWAYRVRTSPRTPLRNLTSPKETPSTSAKPTSQTRFIQTRILLLTSNFLALDILNELTHRFNPYFTDPSHRLTRAPWKYRLTVFFHPAMVYAGLNCMYYPWCIASVWLGASEPEEWPYLFGEVGEAWSVSGCWNRFWHQVMRGHLKSNSSFVVKDILGFRPEWVCTHYLEIAIAFLFSGLMHVAGEYMANRGRTVSYGALIFFALQPLALALGRILSGLSGRLGYKPRPIFLKALGYVWVVTWFTFSLPLWVEQLMRAGFMTSWSNIPRGITRTVIQSLFRALA
ncbi:hypothetical protein CC1G_02313 [Coprinopsis cinerea okayama7|uniref:Wax synthase domain-containing protein n=1 Tax=Coprinopsis cinerea (strain Okayama-7 / 130 / ATCC MYA-4618 / FGSC 9003) TaxID=240176 RepID=A8N7Q6_COPC7|nr:hypothetical protein CC1G_02313 [Coprinopsis cinerea okayama7\|eukprot:XP_001830862.2 hypothetical protein CC1G_02313 [Coprinopsis cinerea okayama7\